MHACVRESEEERKRKGGRETGVTKEAVLDTAMPFE